MPMQKQLWLGRLGVDFSKSVENLKSSPSDVAGHQRDLKKCSGKYVNEGLSLVWSQLIFVQLAYTL